jgi:hypothetical protein
MSRACLFFLFSVLAAAQNAKLPDGVEAVWDVEKASHESTPTRERISINGLWRWQPAASAITVPASGWGYLRVPESWPEGKPANPFDMRGGGPTVFFPQPAWDLQSLGSLKSAWYQREITIPAGWSGRHITLYAEHINSFAEVYVDGAKAGELRYPAGELDLTARARPGATHTLSMMVTAMPLQAVMLSFSDSANAKTMEGRVARKGLCGDVYVVSTPAGARIEEVRVETSVREWQIAFSTALTALDSAARYILRAEIRDGNRLVKEIASKPFKAADLEKGRFRFTEPWRPDKLWDIVTPKNQYELSLSLTAAGKTLDTALSTRFGFRELWIAGKDFYLNGTRIYLSSMPIDNGQLSYLYASYEAARATLQRFKSMGVNYAFTHNYGCEPGSHIIFHDVLRAADDEGVLLGLSQPHFGHYDWTAPDADSKNGYAQHAAFYARLAGNHPSVVFYSTSHNSTGYSQDMNPDLIDGVNSPREQWALRNVARAERAEAIVRGIDPSRITYHHASGNLGPMHLMNFYVNWVPIQEMSDWFEHWATTGVKPAFICEYGVPFMWDWAMYRGWYKGKREFGRAVAPWEFHVAEWNAQFLGPRAYQVQEEEKTNLRWEAARFAEGKPYLRMEYPYNLNSTVFEERFRVLGMYLTDNYRAFRTWGVSGFGPPWDYAAFWKNREPRLSQLPLDIAWDRLQRPGPRVAYVNEEEAKAKLAYDPKAERPTAASNALVSASMPLLAYIAGKPSAFTSKDHNFLPGETVEKQIVVINNSRRTVTAESNWSFRGASGTKKVSLATGEQVRIPLRFVLPEETHPGKYEINARVRFSTGEAQEDTFVVDVLPKLVKQALANSKLALFDPKGEAAAQLTSMGLPFTRIESGASLASYDTLVIGKGALTVSGPGPDIARVRDGLRVLVFEQTGDVLEQRFGFRIAEYGLRWVFPRVAGHPVMAGLTEDHLRNWRGASTTLSPRLQYEVSQAFNYVPTVKWAGITVPRVWRAGNRGSVASALIEKPARGDFLPLLDGGYALQYSPLLEYREGRGMVLFCQMEVNGRTETDPAAQALARNIVSYVLAWKPPVRRTPVYVGDSIGLKYLQSAGIAAAEPGGGVGAGQLLIVGPGGGSKLPRHAGATVLALGVGEHDARALGAKTVLQEHIAAYFEPFDAASPLAGVSPAEVHNRDPRKFPLVTGPGIVGDGVLAVADGGRLVFSQIAPWQFADYSGERMNVKRTFRKVACLTARLLGNLGATGETPLLPRFAAAPSQIDKRWLDGLYLDIPEEWDDPYRFFRW